MSAHLKNTKASEKDKNRQIQEQNRQLNDMLLFLALCWGRREIHQTEDFKAYLIKKTFFCLLVKVTKAKWEIAKGFILLLTNRFIVCLNIWEEAW